MTFSKIYSQSLARSLSGLSDSSAPTELCVVGVGVSPLKTDPVLGLSISVLGAASLPCGSVTPVSMTFPHTPRPKCLPELQVQRSFVAIAGTVELEPSACG